MVRAASSDNRGLLCERLANLCRIACAQVPRPRRQAQRLVNQLRGKGGIALAHGDLQAVAGFAVQSIGTRMGGGSNLGHNARSMTQDTASSAFYRKDLIDRVRNAAVTDPDHCLAACAAYAGAMRLALLACLTGFAAFGVLFSAPAHAQRQLTDAELAEFAAALQQDEAICTKSRMQERFGFLDSCVSRFWTSFNVAQLMGRVDLMDLIASAYRRAAGDTGLSDSQIGFYWHLMQARLALLTSRPGDYDRWMQQAIAAVPRNLDALTVQVLAEYAERLDREGRRGEAAPLWDRLERWMTAQIATHPAPARLDMTVSAVATMLSRRALYRRDPVASKRLLERAIATYDRSFLADHLRRKDKGWLDILRLRAVLAMTGRDLAAAQADLDAALVIARERAKFDPASLVAVLGSRRTLAEQRGDAPAYVAATRELRTIVRASTHAEDPARAAADIELGKALAVVRRTAEARVLLKSGIDATLAAVRRKRVYAAADQAELRALQEPLKFQIYLSWGLAAAAAGQR